MGADGHSTRGGGDEEVWGERRGARLRRHRAHARRGASRLQYLPDDTSSRLTQSRISPTTRHHVWPNRVAPRRRALTNHMTPPPHAVPSDRVRRGFHVAQRDEVSQRAQRRRRGRGRRRAREQGMGRDETAADDERRGVLAVRRVVAPARIADVTRARREAVRDGSQVRSIHWSPYDGVRVVNADP